MISPAAVGRDVHVLLASEEEFFAEVYEVRATTVRLGLWGTSSRVRELALDEIVAIELVTLPQAEVLKIAARKYQKYAGRAAQFAARATKRKEPSR